MKITIIAATGGVGRQLVSQAVAAGHDVTAVARNTAKLPPDVLTAGTARVVTADLARPDLQALASAVAGPMRCCRRWARTTTRTPGSPPPAPERLRLGPPRGWVRLASRC